MSGHHRLSICQQCFLHPPLSQCPQMPGLFDLQLPHAGSWRDAKEGGWIRARGEDDSVPGLGLLPGLVPLPSLPLPWGLSGGKRRSPGRDKTAPHLLQLHPGLTTPQRKMKVAVVSVALLFTILLCTPADAKVRAQCHGEGLKAGGGSRLHDIWNGIAVVRRKPLDLASPFPNQEAPPGSPAPPAPDNAALSLPQLHLFPPLLVPKA